LSLPAAAQTQIDLRTQTRNVDFTGAVSTRPLKTGSALPATCQVGDMFFKTDASAGSNLYGCTATNTWSGQAGSSQAGSSQGNLTIESDGTTVGQRGAINFEAGPGVMTVMTDTGSAVNVLLGLDTAVVQTPWGEQTGSALVCASTGGSSSSYQCSLQPTLQEYTTGMTLHWTPDVNGAGGPTSLNVDTLGAVPVKQADGATDPSAAQLPAGQLQTIWYDGAKFRLTNAGAVSTIPTIPSTTSVLKGDGSGNVVAAASGTDYAPAPPGTSILKGNGTGGFSSALAGTDYQAPGNYISGLTGDVTANGPGSAAASVTKVNGGSIPASAALVGTDSSGRFTSLAVASLPATCTPGGIPSVVAYTTGGSTQVCSCTGTNTWTCGASANSTTNGTNGQALTSNGSGGFGTPVTTTATPLANAIPQSGAGGTLAAGWLPFPAASAIGGVKSQNCSGTGHVLSIGTDGTVTCSADSGSSTTTYAFRGLEQAGVSAWNVSYDALTNITASTVDSTHTTPMWIVTANSTGGAFRARTQVTTANPSIVFTLAVRSTDSVNAGRMALAYACQPAGTAVDNPTPISLTAMSLTTMSSTKSVYQSTQSVTCAGTTASPADLITWWTPTAPSGGTLSLIWWSLTY
jgi:hypothetical protein